MSTDAEKARKLLRLAEDAKGTPEGDVARKMLDKLFAKHGWDEANISRRDHILLKPDLPEYEEWRRSLLILVAENADVAVVEVPEGAGMHGVEVDIAPAVLLFETMVRRIRVAASEFAEEAEDYLPERVSTNRWYSGFAYWAVMGLLERLISEGSDDEESSGEEETEGEDDRVSLDEDDETREPPEWASMDRAEESFQEFMEGDEVVLDYCREGYDFGQEVPLILGIGSAPEYDMPLLLEQTCEAV